jgi:hypothetical protein
MIKLNELSDHIRSHHGLKEMIKTYIEKLIFSTYAHCCNVISVDFPLVNIKVSLKVKCDQQDQFEKSLKSQIIDKIQK